MRQIFHKLMEFMRSDTPESAGRFALLFIIFNWTPIGVAVAWYIWYKTFYYLEGPDWEGLGIFVGAMGVFYTGLLAMKAVNKAQENKDPKNQTNENA